MDAIDKAFKQVDRQNFVLTRDKELAYFDMPLRIGHGQTISQPTTVSRMLHWLDVKKGDKILDIGSGSGWTTALLANITGPEGHVYAVERVSELVEFGRKNCVKPNVKNAKFFQAGKKLGLEKYAPYDRILVSASAKKFPKKLLEQLKTGGKLVIPVKNNILEITKTSKTKHKTITHSGYVFVPLL